MRYTLRMKLLIFFGFGLLSMAYAQPVFEASSGTFIFQGHELDPAIFTDTLIITNAGDGLLNWTASWNESWLDVVPASGTAPSTVEIKVTAEALSAQNHWDHIILEAPDAANSPYYINVFFDVVGDCQGRCSNSNGDASLAISDAVYIINFIFVGGNIPKPVLACGDSNGDCKVNISDAIWIINMVFVGGPYPTDCCPGGWEGQGGDCCPY